MEGDVIRYYINRLDIDSIILENSGISTGDIR